MWKEYSFYHHLWTKAVLVTRDDVILCYLDPSIFHLLSLGWVTGGIAYLSLSQPMAGLDSHSHSHLRSNQSSHFTYPPNASIFGLREEPREHRRTQGEQESSPQNSPWGGNIANDCTTMQTQKVYFILRLRAFRQHPLEWLYIHSVLLTTSKLWKRE